jgi:hypothetical protein
MAGVDFALMGREIKHAARRAFTTVRSGHPDETFYAFALYSDDDAMTVVPSANTEQGNERCVKRCQGDKSYMEFIASEGIPFAGCLSHLRWGTAEWAYEGVGAKPFKTVNKRINADDRYDDADPDGFVRFKGGLFATMVLGLQDLDAEGFFGTGSARQSVTLLCSISDSPCAVWLEEESARRLNPPSVYQAFFKEWMTDKAIAKDFRKHRRRPDDVYRAFVAHLQAAR